MPSKSARKNAKRRAQLRRGRARQKLNTKIFRARKLKRKMRVKKMRRK